MKVVDTQRSTQGNIRLVCVKNCRFTTIVWTYQNNDVVY
ncbi:hypothetical protein MGSAQ_002382 [marine sediment metagenome]|uniref:Uncharacterized protein n=1 Tax=marine sediment metagenome TaxID=412755 RepID=A0A1B6NT67_9ZZZZ